MSYDGSPSTATHARDSYFPPQPQRPMTAGNQQTDDTTQPPRHPNNFLRRRTDLSAKEIKEEAKGGAFRLKNFINVEGGLDITLNCETNPRDPAGITHPYRVLVPALRFEGDFEPSEPRVKKHWWKISRGRKKAEQQSDVEQVGSEALIQPVEDMGQGQSHGHGQSHSGQKYEQEGPNHVARHPLKNHDNDYDDGYDDNDDYDEEYDDEVGLPPLPQLPPAGVQSVSAPSGGMATPQPRKKWLGII